MHKKELDKDARRSFGSVLSLSHGGDLPAPFLCFDRAAVSRPQLILYHVPEKRDQKLEIPGVEHQVDHNPHVPHVPRDVCRVAGRPSMQDMNKVCYI